MLSALPTTDHLATLRDGRGLPVPVWPAVVLPSTTVIIWHPTQRDLLYCHQRADNGYWGCIGGAQEPGETIGECARREATEETGWDITLERLVCIDSDPTQGACCVYGDRVVQYCNFTFTARIRAHAWLLGPTLSEESRSWGWFAPAHLPHPFLASHRWRIAQAITAPMALTPCHMITVR